MNRRATLSLCILGILAGSAQALAAPISQECSILSRSVAFSLARHATTQSLSPALLKRTLKAYAEKLFEGGADFFLQGDFAQLRRWRAQTTVETLRLALEGEDCTRFEEAANQRISALLATRQILGSDPERLISAVTAAVLEAGSSKSTQPPTTPRTPSEVLPFTVRRLALEVRQYLIESGSEFRDLELEAVATFYARRHFLYLENLLRSGSHYFVDQMLASFTYALDPHSRYRSPDQALAYQDPGVGLDAGKPTPLGLTVQSVNPHSHAAKNGIRPGDFITELDGDSVIGWPTWFFETRLAESIGLWSRLKIQRRDGKSFEVQLAHSNVVRAMNVVKLSRTASARKNILTIRIEEFYPGLGNQLRALLSKELKTHRADAVLLDLRDNPGGLVSEALEVLGVFVEDAIAAMALYSGLEDRPLAVPKHGRLWSGPLTVLVNRNTASAAEIVAGALQDFKRALVLGSQAQTYGKGSIQICFDRFVDYPRGVACITHGLYYLPSGRSPQLNGIPSDIVMNAEENSEDILERGYNWAIAGAELQGPLLQPASPKRSLNCLVLDSVRIAEHLNQELHSIRARLNPPDQKLTAQEQTAAAQSLTATFAGICAL